MKEVTKRVYPFTTNLYCKCKGEYRFSGNVRSTNVFHYEHVCGSCGDKIEVDKSYPRISYQTLQYEMFIACLLAERR